MIALLAAHPGVMLAGIVALGIVAERLDLFNVLPGGPS